MTQQPTIPAKRRRKRRHPLIGRDGRPGYLMAMAISFALTVSLTRAFLAASGYPQIGGGTFHLAHAVWGGLILIITSVAPLMYASRRVFTFSAVASGIGAGLFIDEIGKFITAKNDYFFPLAATLIYVFGLVVAWLAARANQKRGLDEPSMISACLELMGDVVDRSLTTQELARMHSYARKLAISEVPSHAETGQWILRMLDVHTDQVRANPPGPIERTVLRMRSWEESHADKRVYTGAIGLLVVLELAMVPFVAPAVFRQLMSLAAKVKDVGELFDPGSFDTASERMMFVAVAVGTFLVMFALIVGLLVWWRRSDATGSRIMLLAMAAQVIIINTLSGYFDIIYLVMRLCIDVPLLLLLLRYRQRFVDEAPEDELA